ncbi:MAG: GxxExxY protein [Acidobacteria bacterium]|nr:MAG: GxxExxY protein [Acidobacteriota bacterium]PIE91045.1 MAG: GxxExxY protein [Acidobacteriota bacterium]
MSELEIADQIVKAAIRIHRKFGPGLLAEVYKSLLVLELVKLGYWVEQEVPYSIVHEGVTLDVGFKADLVVQDRVIVGFASDDAPMKVEKQKMTTCLRLTGYKLGYLLNFGEEWMKDGISRFFNSGKPQMNLSGVG